MYLFMLQYRLMNHCIDYEISGVQSYVWDTVPYVQEYGEGDWDVFSEELRDLDKNTVKYMIEEQQKEIDRQKEELSRKDEQLSLMAQQITGLTEELERFKKQMQ